MGPSAEQRRRGSCEDSRGSGASSLNVAHQQRAGTLLPCHRIQSSVALALSGQARRPGQGRGQVPECPCVLPAGRQWHEGPGQGELSIRGTETD